LNCLIFLTAAAQTSASLISIQLKGQVDSVVGNPFGFGLSEGEPFSALFIYDPSTPPAFARTDQNIYFQATSYAVTVAGHHFAPVANDWFVFMSNDAGGGDFITFSAGSYPAGYGTIAIDGVANPDAGFIVYLIDTMASLWNSV